MTFKQFQWLCGSLVLGVQMAASCCAEIQVFGDSLSDTGNFSVVAGGGWPPSPPYYNGRFTDGRVWVEYLADSLDEAVPMPAMLGGTNYAFNGSRAAGLSPYGTPDLETQVASYLSVNEGVANPNDIFVVWAGANDLFFNAGAVDMNFIPEAIEGISRAIRTLHEAGARTFIVPDLPLLGQTPYFNSSPTASSDLDLATMLFNSLLSEQLRGLRKEMRTLCIVDVKVSRLFKAITQSSKRFQLDNVTDSATLFDPFTGIGIALSPGVDPSRYLFWDSIHPTTQSHKIIAEYALFWLEVRCEP